MGDFNTKLTTDGYRLKHSYNDEAGEDRRLTQLLPATRPHRDIDADRRALRTSTLEARQAISFTHQLQPIRDAAGTRTDYTHESYATHHRSCMDYIFASATLQTGLTHSEVCHDLRKRSDRIPLLAELRWKGNKIQRGGDTASTRFKTNWQPSDEDANAHKVATTLGAASTHDIDSHAQTLQDSAPRRTPPQQHKTDDEQVRRLTARRRLATTYDECHTLSK